MMELLDRLIAHSAKHSLPLRAPRRFPATALLSDKPSRASTESFIKATIYEQAQRNLTLDTIPSTV